MVMRLIASTKSEILKMNAAQLKESILASEGRVIMGQHHVMLNSGLVDGTTNTEIQAAYGADMVMLNGFDVVNEKANIGLTEMKHGKMADKPYTLQQVKEWSGVPLGIYFECPSADAAVAGERYVEAKAGRVASKENFLRALEIGADFIVLGGNPSAGTTFERIIAATQLAKKTLGSDMMICAGKWEDGTIEKVLGDPLSERPSNDIIKDLIDAGADVITLPAPGSRHGITIEHVRQCVQFVHSYKPGTLALSFLNSSVEGADTHTIAMIALMMKQTGADIHAIGDGGYAGTPLPENVYQLALSIKGRRHTIKRMTGRSR
ncbi:hypothetical protein QW71_03135 [Paenibacillus sp. IHB B 3415]|uniref:DUF7916 family protein n=1 Tax=Paenibacillus sp. IHB B 3415 TaxID=867080 RepID=UPI000574F6EE|nr:hypothetical protein [Paenibacillus sp. IHB B 3415]KHL97162.1 hypothetical protein QW71_03135 [Paenibacillus sp. IHB B 3415]